MYWLFQLVTYTKISINKLQQSRIKKLNPMLFGLWFMVRHVDNLDGNFPVADHYIWLLCGLTLKPSTVLKNVGTENA